MNLSASASGWPRPHHVHLGMVNQAEDIDAAERNANAVGADAVLDGGADAALGHDGIGDKSEDDVDEHEDLDERDKDVRNPAGNAGGDVGEEEGGHESGRFLTGKHEIMKYMRGGLLRCFLFQSFISFMISCLPVKIAVLNRRVGGRLSGAIGGAGSEFQVDAEVADFAEAQAGEGGTGFGHGFEDFLDGVDAVAAAEGRLELDAGFASRPWPGRARRWPC